MEQNHSHNYTKNSNSNYEDQVVHVNCMVMDTVHGGYARIEVKVQKIQLLYNMTL